MLVLFISLLAKIQARADQFDTLRLYWQSQLVGTNLSGSTLTSRATTASNYWTTINTNTGRTSLWTNAPLGSVSANMTTHFSRLQAMALAWATPGCSLQGNASLAAAITNGLDWMCVNSYTTTASEYDNWWDWEIGGLQAFNNAAVLIYPALTAVQITNYNNSVDHFCPGAKGWMTGANLTDKCKDMIIRGILGKSSAKLATAQTNLSPVFLYVTSGDGFYRDGSFVQHTRIAYTGTYGIVLLGDVAQLVNLLNGSTWQITDPNLTNVYNWVVNSYEPVIYHGAMMDMVRGRSIGRYGETETGDGSSAISDIKQIASFAPAATANAFTNWASSAALPPGQYHFAGMDRVVAWRSNFCFALSMSSTRIANYESINGENLRGWFTGDGMTYLYFGNSETQFNDDFWPTVDLYHLPGTTTETVARPDGAREATATTQNWVGGAQVADNYGVAGMSLAATNSLTAKKSWFMFDKQVVCLGAGVTCGDATEVDTSVENRRLGLSPTNHLYVNGTNFPPTIGWNSNLTSVRWCSLDGVAGYYFPGGATNLRAAFVANTGSWSQINNGTYVGTTTNLYTDDYLTLWFNHGVKPTNSTYAYVILPNYTAGNMTSYATNPDVVVITNTVIVQAASRPDAGLVAANFWTDGTNSADLITVNKKSSVITAETMTGLSVGVSDPTQTNTGTIKVTLNRAATGTLSSDAGVTVVQLSPQIILSVNVNGSLGQSYQASFLYSTPTVTWDANQATSGAQDGSGTWNNASTVWWTGSSNVAWNDTAPYVASFGAGGVAGTAILPSSHIASALVFNSVSSGCYTLSGTGTLTISNGIIANASAVLNMPVNLGASQTWTIASGQTLNISGNISAPITATLSLTGGGIVNLSGVTAMGGTITVSTNATLGGAGMVTGMVTVQAGGTIQAGNANGAGTLSINTLNLGNDPKAITASRFSILNGGTIATTNLNITGTNIINVSDGSLAIGTNTLMTYSGVMGGNGFAGLKLGALPTLPPGTRAMLQNTGSAIQLIVAPPTAPALSSASAYSADGFTLNFSGSSGQAYRVLASSDLSVPLTNWLVLTNGIFGSSAENFTDGGPTNANRFYRISSP